MRDHARRTAAIGLNVSTVNASEQTVAYVSEVLKRSSTQNGGTCVRSGRQLVMTFRAGDREREGGVTPFRGWHGLCLKRSR